MRVTNEVSVVVSVTVSVLVATVAVTVATAVVGQASKDRLVSMQVICELDVDTLENVSVTVVVVIDIEPQKRPDAIGTISYW